MKFTYLTLFVSLIAISSCNIKDTIEDLATFNITNSTDFTIPSSSIIDVPIDVGTPEIRTSSQQTFDNNNTKADLVENVNLSDLKLTITDPNDRDFSFLKSIKIYIENDEQGETLIAELEEVPANASNVIDLETTGENLDEYIKKDSYSLNFEVVTDETTNSATSITADMVFEVRANIL